MFLPFVAPGPLVRAGDILAAIPLDDGIDEEQSRPPVVIGILHVKGH